MQISAYSLLHPIRTYTKKNVSKPTLSIACSYCNMLYTPQVYYFCHTTLTINWFAI